MPKPNVGILATKDWVISLINKVIKRRDGETLASDVAEIKNDLGGLSFSASGTTLSITDGTNTWTLGANS